MIGERRLLTMRTCGAVGVLSRWSRSSSAATRPQRLWHAGGEPHLVREVAQPCGQLRNRGGTLLAVHPQNRPQLGVGLPAGQRGVAGADGDGGVLRSGEDHQLGMERGTVGVCQTGEVATTGPPDGAGIVTGHGDISRAR